MGLNFKILVIWKALSTMPPKVSLSTASVKPSGFGDSGSKVSTVTASTAASVATSVALPKAAPKTAPAAPLPCKHPNCWGCPRCGKTPPKKDKGGNGNGGAEVAGLRKEIGELRTLVQQGFQKQTEQASEISAKVESGFNEQRQLSLELQKQGNESFAKTMKMFEVFGNMMTGGAAMAPRSELPASPAHRAICAPTKTTGSKITEIHDERPSARGGGCATEGGRSSKLTGADIDPFLVACGSVFPQDGTLFRALCQICGKTGLSDYHKQLISSIKKVTIDDNLAALLFLLLTGSKQFRKGSFNDFRTSCDAMLGSNRTNTQAAFSQVCDYMLRGMRDWEINKNGGINVPNADLKNASKRISVFNDLVSNFQS